MLVRCRIFVDKGGQKSTTVTTSLSKSIKLVQPSDDHHLDTNLRSVEPISQVRELVIKHGGGLDTIDHTSSRNPKGPQDRDYMTRNYGSSDHHNRPLRRHFSSAHGVITFRESTINGKLVFYLYQEKRKVGSRSIYH